MDDQTIFNIEYFNTSNEDKIIHSDIIKTILNETVPDIGTILRLVCSQWNIIIGNTSNSKEIQKYCVKGNYLKVLQYLDSKGVIIYSEALDLAIFHGRKDIVKWMHSLGVISCNILTSASKSDENTILDFVIDLFFNRESIPIERHINEIEKILISKDNIIGLSSLSLRFMKKADILCICIPYGSIRIIKTFLPILEESGFVSHQRLVLSAILSRQRNILQYFEQKIPSSMRFITLNWLSRGDMYDLIPKYKNNNEFWHFGLQGAAKFGDLELFKECYENGRDLPELLSNTIYLCETVDLATKSGNLELIKYLFNNGFKFGPSFYSVASIEGYFHILEWGFNKNIEKGNNNLINNALIGGFINIADWGIKNGFTFNVKNSILVDKLRYTINNSTEFENRLSERVLTYIHEIIRCPKKQSLIWLLEHDYVFDQDDIMYLVEVGNIELLKIVHCYLQYVISENIFLIWDIAAIFGRLDILEWIRKENYLDESFKEKHTIMIKFNNFLNDVIDETTTFPREVHVLEWFQKNNYNFNVGRSFEHALKYNLVDLLIWFTAKRIINSSNIFIVYEIWNRNKNSFPKNHDINYWMNKTLKTLVTCY